MAHHHGRDHAPEAFPLLRIRPRQDEVVGDGHDPPQFQDGELPVFERVAVPAGGRGPVHLTNRPAGGVKALPAQVEVGAVHHRSTRQRLARVTRKQGKHLPPLVAASVLKQTSDLLRVVLQALERFPQRIHIGERLRVDGFPVQILADTDEDQPLPALRDAEVLRVKYRGLHAVAAFLKGAQNELEVPLGRPDGEPLDVLRNEYLGPEPLEQPRVLEKEIVHALRLVAVGVGLAPSLFPLPTKRERAARRGTVEQVYLRAACRRFQGCSPA